jgi:hypothetical protein
VVTLDSTGISLEMIKKIKSVKNSAERNIFFASSNDDDAKQFEFITTVAVSSAKMLIDGAKTREENKKSSL